MAELPYALMSHCGGTSGFPEQYEPVVRKHFQIVYLEEFLNNKTVFASKIKAILLWWHRPTVNKELLKLLPNLKVIGSSGAGVDHLDLQLIASYGIKVTNTPHVGNDATADMGMALMLASAKNIMEAHRISCSPETKEFDLNWVGDDITGATLGIIGMGNIGYSIALRAKAFRMRILYHNRNRRITILLSIICFAGKVVDQDALVEALENRTIKAAALDVTDPEPLPRNHPLLTMKNVILTPHIGNASDKTRRKVAEKLATNASDIIKGLPIIDIVTAP
ncbi:hypothetical protein XELAEV_18031744mg [Xenopus laevis]|uniref:Uncharacterized protein n=1 Tax=Xenopus laevis TaxID=8355 RepID=A0A974CQI3_XENLA|nr:hypothetical protein XELAEV_18031744mg [Xenopus laevis]